MAYPEKYRQRVSLGQPNNALTKLIIFNLVVFVLLQLIKLFFYFIYRQEGQGLSLYEDKVLEWFVLPADLNSFISKPWTLLTHMFVHDGILHVLGNTLWLWAFGYILQDLTGNKKIVPVFIYGGIAGAVTFMLAYNLLPALQAQLPYQKALGASAGCMAIAIVTTMISPGYRIFPMLNGGIPLWVLTVIYLIIDLAMIPYSNPGGHIAHLGGAFMGFLFMVFLRRGYDGSEWMNNFYDWLNNLFNPDRPRKGKNKKEELFYKSNKNPYQKTPNVTQQRIDAILDKINQKGFNYLTEEEKELLKRASQE